VSSVPRQQPEALSQVALQPNLPATVAAADKKPFYTRLSFQVLLAILLAILLGHFSPARAVALKPLGDAFIRLITMIITLVIFCTVVTGIAGMEDMKKVGRVGGKALLYFETVSTVALLIGLIVGNVVQPGRGWNIDAKTLDPKAIADYAGPAKAQSVSDFILHIIPTTVTDAFAKGDILQVLFILNPSGVRNCKDPDAFCPHWGIWSHGFYCRQVRHRGARSVTKTDRSILFNVHLVCGHSPWSRCIPRRIQYF
jgi:hypothetical protein